MKPRTSMLLLGFALALGMSAFTTDKPAWADAPNYRAKISGDNVYVRSGPDHNYYPVGRLSRGQTVDVFGEQYGWLKITPPQGIYSLIEKHYLDLTREGLGVVNADYVNVRAAGEIAPQIYARQIKLNRGAEVQILGERQANLDGKILTFYKIEPPPGTFLWIAAKFAQRDDRTDVPDEPAGSVEHADPGRAKARLASTDLPAPSDAPTPSVIPTDAPSSADETDHTDSLPSPDRVQQEIARLRAQLASLEKQLAPELAKPFPERNLAPFVDRFMPLSEQQTDRVVQQYARLRLEQFRHQIELAATMRDLRLEDRQLHEDRKQFMRERNGIRIDAIPTVRTFDLTGELRESNVYNSPVLPRRYRLVDPNTHPPMTIAYIEIPRDSIIDPSPLLGRYVGVVAAQRSYHPGLVNPLPIIIPAEIVPTDTPDAKNASSDGGDQSSG